MDIKTLAASQKARLADERERNRAQFPFIAEWLDVLAAAGIQAKVQHATNGTREVGERFEDRCAREGHVPCTYWPNGASSNQRFSTTSNSAKEAV